MIHLTDSQGYSCLVNEKHISLVTRYDAIINKVYLKGDRSVVVKESLSEMNVSWKKQRKNEKVLFI